MRIAVLMNQGSPWAQQIVGSLQDLGCIVDVLSFPIDQTGGVTSLQNPAAVKATLAFRERVGSFHELQPRSPPRLRYFLALPRLRRILRNLQPDVLLSLYAGGLGVTAWLSGFRPYALYLMGSDVLLAGRPLRWLNRFVIGAAARTLANGTNLAHQAGLQAPGASIESLLFGIDMELFSPSDGERIPTLVCTRSFQRLYDNEIIIRALSLLPDDLPLFRMSFVSAGEELEACQLLADRLLSPHRRSEVIFHGGMSPDEVVRTVAGADVYVSMSRSDGTSTSLLEGLACQLIPVVSDIPANREWVSPGEAHGMLVPVGDAQALSHALESVLRDLEGHKRKARVGRELVASRADALTNRRRLLAALKGIISDDSPVDRSVPS